MRRDEFCREETVLARSQISGIGLHSPYSYNSPIVVIKDDGNLDSPSVVRPSIYDLAPEDVN